MVAKQQAGSSSSLTAELLHKIKPMPYKTYVAKINECDAVTPDNFKNSRWANYFTVDSSNIVKNGRGNPNHVFDLFGTFSGHTGTEVRVKLLENIATEMPFYETRSAVCLQMRSMNLETWVNSIANELVYCDELYLMELCHMYQWHCVVLTKNKLWFTVQADKPMNLLNLLNICSMHLIYLGNLRFGVLTWRPHLPKKVATKSPGFNIVEEYMIDDAEATSGASKSTPDATSSPAVNVALANMDVQQHDQKPNEPPVVKTGSVPSVKTEATSATTNATPGTSAGDDNTSATTPCVETRAENKPPKYTEDTVQTQSEACVNEPPTEESALPVVTTNENITAASTLEQGPVVPSNVKESPSLSDNSMSTTKTVTCLEGSPANYLWKRQLCVRLN